MTSFLIDTHTHLFLPDFDSDRDDMIERAINRGVNKYLMPNIDSTSIKPMMKLAGLYPDNCFPMMGLHPTSVKEDYLDELYRIKHELENGRFFGIGETGIDLHWETKYLYKQCIAFEEQIKLGIAYGLPVIIHARKSFNEIFEVLEGFRGSPLTGIFHAFTGDMQTAEKVLEMGFLLGIGGIVTFKKSGLDEVVRNVDLEHIVLETDSPYLAPVPMRGKRNESAYLYYIAEAVARIWQISVDKVAQITTANTYRVFNKLTNDRSD